MTRIITTLDELMALPEGSMVRAEWPNGAKDYQAPYVAIRSAKDGGASGGGYGVLDETRWGGLLFWNATLTLVPSGTGEVVESAAEIAALPAGTQVLVTWPVEDNRAPYRAIRSGSDSGAASGGIGILAEFEWARLSTWGAQTIEVVNVPDASI
jgi:hypothetical protein